MKKGNPFGAHRVLEPQGVFPQAAFKLNNDFTELFSNEILIKVERLNIDSASFTQLKNQALGDVNIIKKQILDIVKQRGKMHNPVTNSGGMLLGEVIKIGEELKNKFPIQLGSKVATLVSLTLTPLFLENIGKVHTDKAQVEVEGKAVIFESGNLACIPADFSEILVLAILDVAGAPIQVGRLIKPGDTVVVIGGGGKSGLLSIAEARRKIGPNGKILALCGSPVSAKRVERLGYADFIWTQDATNALATYEKVKELTKGNMADVVINVVNVPFTEMSSIVSARDGGIIYFFSMATSFTAAALGAEGISKDVNMVIGNGYGYNHSEYALDLVRKEPVLRKILSEMFE